MADGRRFNGGHRTAGRKSKSEEQKLVEKLGPMDPLAMQALWNALEAEKQWAVRLYFNYMYGKPVETQRVFTQEEIPLFPDVQPN